MSWPKWITPKLLEEAKRFASQYQAVFRSGEPRAHDVTATWNQYEFRWAAINTGVTSAPTWEADESVDLVLVEDGNGDYDIQLWVAFGIPEANATTNLSCTAKLQVSKNSGTFYDIDDSVNQSWVTMIASTGFADGAAVTFNGVGSGGSHGTYQNGEAQETDDTADTVTAPSNQKTYFNHVWALRLVDAQLANGDTLDFRVLHSSDTLFENDPADNARITWQSAFIGIDEGSPDYLRDVLGLDLSDVMVFS